MLTWNYYTSSKIKGFPMWWTRRYQYFLVALFFVPVMGLFWHCGQNVDALRTCSIQADCFTGQLCVRNVCVSQPLGRDESANQEPHGIDRINEISQEPPVLTESTGVPDETPVNDVVPDGSGESTFQEPGGTEPRQNPEDIDQDGSPVLMIDAGAEDGLPDDMMGRERRFVPEPPDESRPPLPDSDIDPEQGRPLDTVIDATLPDENTGRFPEQRPDRIPEALPADIPTSSDQRVDSHASCKPGESRKCYPEGTLGCDSQTGTCTGICRWGTQHCTNATWGNCVGAKLPERETCNQQDDDCNGMIDEGGRCP